MRSAAAVNGGTIRSGGDATIQWGFERARVSVLARANPSLDGRREVRKEKERNSFSMLEIGGARVRPRSCALRQQPSKVDLDPVA
jgi:hypothetical protein